MIGALLFVLALTMSSAGFALLAASQRQHRAVLSRSFAAFAGPPRILRWAGAGILFASLCLAAARDGWAFGFVVWILTITISAFAVSLALTLLRQNGPGAAQATRADNDDQ